MTQDYRSMWEKLGLDLDAHDALLEMLGQLYAQTFMSQRNRPKGMEYFDFVMSEVHGLRVKEIVDAKKEGRKVFGSFCVFVPEEIVLAVDGILVGLCAGAEFGLEEAENLLPRNTCSLIKGAFGFTLSNVCPYINAADMVIGENTCDGKKKSYEIFRDLVSDMYVMDMPQMKNEVDRDFLRHEYRRFAARVEEVSGRKIEIDALRKAIGTVNAKRGAMHRLAGLRAADPAPISGLDALLANQVYFYDDPIRFTESSNQLCNELEERIGKGEGIFDKGTPRILISGCPMAVPNWKLPSIIEGANAVIVGEESCVGERGTRHLTDSTGETVEQLIDNIVDRYFKIDCAVFTPNNVRLEHIKEMAKSYKADGVIHYGLQFCAPYQIEAGPVEKALEADNIPTLRIDTDYSSEDTGQIRTRVEAFIERLQD